MPSPVSQATSAAVNSLWLFVPWCNMRQMAPTWVCIRGKAEVGAGRRPWSETSRWATASCCLWRVVGKSRWVAPGNPCSVHLGMDTLRCPVTVMLSEACCKACCVGNWRIFWGKETSLHTVFLLNQQHFRLRKCDVAPVPGLVLQESEIEDHADALVQQFLCQNGFSSICDRDKAGWSPLCYAAVNGNPELLTAMLRKRADPNDSLRKSYRAAYIDKDSSALYICCRFGNNEAMRILLAAQANPSKADSLGFTPLCAVAVFADNVEGARLLLQARADASAENGFGQTAFTVAATYGATRILKELLNLPTFADSKQKWDFAWCSLCLSSTCRATSLFYWRLAVTSMNLFTYRKMPNRLLFGFFTLRHFVKRKSPMSTLAYHHAGATPLMMSILANYYAASHLLIHAKARLDLQNSRHQTAFDLAIKTCAPDFLLQELWQHGAANYASEASRSTYLVAYEWCAGSNRPLIPSEEVVSQEMQEEDDPDDPDDPMVSIQFWLGDNKNSRDWSPLRYDTPTFCLMPQ